jgi:hypothetical protein
LPFWHLSCLGSLRPSFETGSRVILPQSPSINFGAAPDRSIALKPRSEVVFAEDGGDGELGALEWHGLDRRA